MNYYRLYDPKTGNYSEFRLSVQSLVYSVIKGEISSYYMANSFKSVCGELAVTKISFDSTQIVVITIKDGIAKLEVVCDWESELVFKYQLQFPN